LLSAFSTGVWTFALFRFITGAGIGGEYAAINSAVDELIPARVRGKVDLLINGTYWLGAALGSVSTLWLLNPAHFDVDLGWRIGFGAGAVIGLGILFLRGMVPESPRWLMLRGREKEAEEIVDKIEKDIESKTGVRLETVTRGLSFHLRPHLTFREVAKVIFGQYRTSSYLGVCLMSAQAFLFNAVFFTYALVLTQFYGIEGKDTGIYLLPFALGNFAGPVCLGHFFDTIGRKPMIVITYTVSGVLLAITGYLFAQGYLSAFSQTLLWTVIFFFASAAASAAYLTVSEIFPLEVRAMAIALFFSLGTGLGGIVAPWLFGTLIGTGSAYAIFGGYLVASILMVGAAMAEWKWGIACERKCLEDIAAPVSSAPMPGIA
jgi:MFS family permease